MCNNSTFSSLLAGAAWHFTFYVAHLFISNIPQYQENTINNNNNNKETHTDKTYNTFLCMGYVAALKLL